MRKLLSQKIFVFTTIVTVTAIFIIACSKNSNTEIRKEEQETITKSNNRSAGMFSMPEHCPGLENPCSDPACAPYFSCDGTVTYAGVQKLLVAG